MANRKYSDEFIAEAVKQVRERGYSVQEVACGSPGISRLSTG